VIRVGIIGCGYSAETFHVPLLQSTAVFSIDAFVSTKPEYVSKRYPFAKVHRTVDDLLSSNSLDLVVVAVPTHKHLEIAKKCITAGVNVILEKPAVCSMEEYDLLKNAANNTDCFISVFHNRRWDGDYLSVRKLMDAQVLGRLAFFESHFDRFRPNVRQRWREQAASGAGIWFDLGSHLVDQALQLFGLPEAVTARCLSMREGSTATDYFHVQLHYQRLEAVLHGSCYSASPNLRFRVEGEKGTYLKQGLDPQEMQLKAGDIPGTANYGKYPDDDHAYLYSETECRQIAQETGCYQEYYRQIAASIETGASVPVPLVEICDVVMLLELAIKSSQLGKTCYLQPDFLP
jgi:predicted dehydrogenase